MPEYEKKLSVYRKEIDEIDDKILELIADRAKIVEGVALLKRKHVKDVLFIRPGREASMLKRMVNSYKGNFPKEAIAQLWRILISGSCNVEEQIRVCCLSTNSDQTYYWLAREYFNQFSLFSKQASSARVIGELLEKKSTVGVMPLPQDAQSDFWWTNLPSKGNLNLKVFAKVPAVISQSTARELSAFLIGNVVPEETGDDKSLIVISVAENISKAKLSSVFTKVGIDASLVAATEYDASKAIVHALFEADGFISNENPKLENLKTELGKALISAISIGSYATQMKF